MSGWPTPILRIEVESVKHSLLQHLQGASQEFANIIAEEIESIDLVELIRLEVRAQAPAIARDAVKSASESIGRSIALRLTSELRDEIERLTPMLGSSGRES